MSIQNVPTDSALFRQVIRLAKRNSATLGFLPDQAFVERAEAGRLLGDVDDAAILRGYVLFDLPRDEIRLVHLCVEPDYRGLGLARALVADVRARHPLRRGIRLSCRRDFPANDLWPKLDFVPLAEREGRSRLREPLTAWWCDFGHPTLFDVRPALDDRTVVAVDSNILSDLLDEAEAGAERLAVRGLLLMDEVDFVVTDEVFDEINKIPERGMRASRRASANYYRRVTSRPEEWRHLYTAMVAQRGAEFSEQDKADARHLARAAAAGVQHFLTRDARLRSRLGPLAETVLGLKVFGPIELLLKVDESRRHGSYRPVQLQATVFSVGRVRGDEAERLQGAFLNTGQGERAAQFKETLRLTLSNPDACECLVIRDDKGTPVALSARSASANELAVGLLRVGRGTASETIARQLVYLQRERALSAGARRIRVTDTAPTPGIAKALRDDAFLRIGSEWWGFCLPRCEPGSSVAEVIEGLTAGIPLEWPRLAVLGQLRDGQPIEPRLAIELERLFWPLKITDAGVPTFIVPIRPRFAQDLFDNALSAQTLFNRPERLGISREHVYYRSPLNSRGLQAPARILWYVSGEGDRTGTMAIRACSRLEEVVSGSPRSLHGRFHHLGVYELSDVQSSAGRNGSVMALRFSDTELFEAPVLLRDLRQMALSHQESLVLQSPCPVSASLFADIYRQGRFAGLAS